MAKVKNPLLSQEAHGALGGIEYRTSTYGNIVGRRSITPHRRTPAQLTNRALIGRAAAAWQALTADYQHAWNDYATYPSSGREAYIRAYIRMAPIGETPNPHPYFPLPLDTFLDFHVAEAYLSSGQVCLRWINPEQNYHMVVVRAQATYSHRSAPQHARLPIVDTVIDANEFAFVYVPPGIPVLHARIEAISNVNGSILGAADTRGNIEWLPW